MAKPKLARTATAKRTAFEDFKIALDDALAGLGEYRKLLLLRMLNTSMDELKTTAKGELRRG